MGEKGTTMVLSLNVDLQCSKCYKKVKKLLCKFSEIRDQVYDEKANKVTIKVVSGSPEKIRDKLCCKGCGSIKSIEIKEPEKPKPKPTTDEKKKEETKKESPPPVRVTIPVGFCCWGCCSGGPCWRDGYCGRPVCDCWGWGCYKCCCAIYCTKENQSLCPIM